MRLLAVRAHAPSTQKWTPPPRVWDCGCLNLAEKRWKTVSLSRRTCSRRRFFRAREKVSSHQLCAPVISVRCRGGVVVFFKFTRDRTGSWRGDEEEGFVCSKIVGGQYYHARIGLRYVVVVRIWRAAAPACVPHARIAGQQVAATARQPTERARSLSTCSTIFCTWLFHFPYF